LSSRERGLDESGVPEELMINLAEYVYFRRGALAWKECTSNNAYIQKIEIKGCGFVIMLPFHDINDNDLNLAWETGINLLPKAETA